MYSAAVLHLLAKPIQAKPAERTSTAVGIAAFAAAAFVPAAAAAAHVPGVFSSHLRLIVLPSLQDGTSDT